jgi:hypothetical protein
MSARFGAHIDRSAVNRATLKPDVTLRRNLTGHDNASGVSSLLNNLWIPLIVISHSGRS